MAKRKPKREPLQPGQIIWLEPVIVAFQRQTNPKLHEMIVTEANKTSAYIWFAEEGMNPKTTARYKVDQRTHQTDYGLPDGCSYRLWLSKETHDKYKQLVAEKRETREAILAYVNGSRTLDELQAVKDFISK